MHVADNNVLAVFVDSGNAELLYRIVGPLREPESVISPDLQNRSSEFNRRLDIPGRREFIQGHGRLWTSEPLMVGEVRLVLQLSQECKKLRRRRGDLEVLVMGLKRGYTILTDDSGLRREAKREKIKVIGSCGLLEMAVQKKILPCDEAKYLYNRVFKEELGLFSTLTFRCPEGCCM